LLLLLFCCCWFWGPLLPLGPILAASSCGKRGRREEEKREGRGEEGEEEGLSYLSQGRFEKKTADACLALDGAFRSSRLLPSFFSSIPLLLMTHLARALAPVAHCGSELSCWCARVAGEEERRGYGRSERERKKRFGTMKTTPWFSLWREKIASRSRPRSENPNSKTPPRAHMRSSGSHGPRERERERRKKGAQRRVNEVFARLFFGDDAQETSKQMRQRFFASTGDGAACIRCFVPPLVSLEGARVLASGLVGWTMSEKKRGKRERKGLTLTKKDVGEGVVESDARVLRGREQKNIKKKHF